MKYTLVFLKVLLPAILCVSIAYLTDGDLLLNPFVFGLIVGIANWKLHKYDPFFCSLFSVLLSYLVFAIGWFGAGFWKYVLQYLFSNIFFKNNISILDLSFLITTYIVAPLLIYLVYRWLFKIPMNKLTILTIIFSIITLVLVNLLSVSNYKLFNNFNVLKIIIWQLIVMLSLQFIINQKDILTIEKT